MNKIPDNNENESGKSVPTILENIEKYVQSLAGDASIDHLMELQTKLICIKRVIETSYQIGDYVEKYEAYQQQAKSATLLESINAMLIPEFKEFIASKFKAAQEEAQEAQEEQ